MPGSGPTDPFLVFTAIKDGATFDFNHLVTSQGPRWLAVVGSRWVLSETLGVGLSQDVFEQVKQASVCSGGILTIGSGRYQLDPPAPTEPQLAQLNPV